MGRPRSKRKQQAMKDVTETGNNMEGNGGGGLGRKTGRETWLLDYPLQNVEERRGKEKDFLCANIFSVSS
jgi:hypothetical protein